MSTSAQFCELITYTKCIVSSRNNDMFITTLYGYIYSLYRETVFSHECLATCSYSTRSTFGILEEILYSVPKGEPAEIPSAEIREEIKKKIKDYMLNALCPFCKSSTVANRDEKERRYQKALRLRNIMNA